MFITSSLWTVRRCRTHESLRENVRLQIVHLKGLSPVCVFQCLKVSQLKMIQMKVLFVKMMKPFEEPILCEAHSTVLAGIGFVQTLLRHPGQVFYFCNFASFFCQKFTKILPPHLLSVWLEEPLAVVAEVLHHLLLPELLHLPAPRTLVLLLLLSACGIISLSSQ